MPVQVGGLLGGPKGMLAPPLKLLGGGPGPPAPPPLFIRLCIIIIILPMLSMPSPGRSDDTSKLIRHYVYVMTKVFFIFSSSGRSPARAIVLPPALASALALALEKC